MFVFVCHKAKKQAIHHVLKRTCFLAHFQKRHCPFWVSWIYKKLCKKHLWI